MCRFLPRLAIVAALLLTASFSLAQAGSPAWTARHIRMLEGDDAAARNEAREQLMRVVDTPGFPSAYPASVAADLLALLKSPNPRAKVNAAIIAEHLAAKTVDPALIAVVSALLDGKSESLALWGVKASRPFIATGSATLARQVATSVKAHADSGPIAEEAYAALVGANIGPTGKAMPVSFSAVLSVLESRTARYANGGAPPSAAAEAPVPVFLSVTCWPGANAAERKQILSDLGDLACSAAASVGNGDRNAALLAVVQNAASALEVIGTRLNNTGLVTAAKTLAGINAGNAALMTGACKSLDSAVKSAAL